MYSDLRKKYKYSVFACLVCSLFTLLSIIKKKSKSPEATVWEPSFMKSSQWAHERRFGHHDKESLDIWNLIKLVNIIGNNNIQKPLCSRT